MCTLLFHTKNTSPIIPKKEQSQLFAYIGAILKDNDSIPIIINGVEDHIHILCVLSKNIALSKLVEEIKRHSSRWIKTLDQHYTKFAWQGGYGCFSISASLHGKTKHYIENQEEHHKKRSFKEEYNVDYNENYLWTD